MIVPGTEAAGEVGIEQGRGPYEASEVSDCGPPIAAVEEAQLAHMLFEADCSASGEGPVVVGASQPEAVAGAQCRGEARLVSQGAAEEVDWLTRRMTFPLRHSDRPGRPSAAGTAAGRRGRARRRMHRPSESYGEGRRRRNKLTKVPAKG